MSVENIVGLSIGVCLLGYLIYALIFPDRF
ncbi:MULTISPECIES: K(+)-transporting ATPase subunit F [Streptomyces]|nr:K(+)-transporting ATPase subunit F [Streptomyces sp. WM6378]KOU35381.1 membrane protein [Streptomyces sp. WM6378]